MLETKIIVVLSLIFLTILMELAIMVFEPKDKFREKTRKNINLVVILGLLALLTLI